MRIKGLNPKDCDISKNGGKHSRLEYRFDLIDPGAIFKLAGVLHEGSLKYSDENWRSVTQKEHLNHTLCHIFAHLAGDSQEDHLVHALCRIMMAVSVGNTGAGMEVDG
jgi:hypothetical protein